MANKLKVLSSKVGYSGKWVEIREDFIIKPDGTKAIHEIAKRKDSVIVLAFENGKLLLTKQYRYPADEILLELPTGFLNEAETPQQAALREFEEESGLIPTKINLIGSFWTWPGFSTQKTYVFLTSNLTKGKISLDSTESDLKSEFIPYKEVGKLVRQGTIKSSTTLAALTIFEQTK